MESPAAPIGIKPSSTHAYSVALDPARLAELRQLTQDARPGLEADLGRLDTFLAELADTVGGS